MTDLSRERMLERARARDATFDGTFLTCVRTTGIYCLPSCRARTPNPENVEHAPSPAEARARGFRPCRRCRPDDHYAGLDPDRQALLLAVEAVRARPAEFADIAAFARAAGCGATKLLLGCRRHLQLAPTEVLLQARLDCARRRLAATRSSVLDVGLDSGFQGSSAFHANFVARLGMTPRAYRTMLATRAFGLVLPPGHATTACLRYHLRDPEAVSERGDDRSLHMATEAQGRAAVLSLQCRGRAVTATVRMADGAAPGPLVMAQLHAVAVRLLRLDLDTAAAERALSGDAALRPLVRKTRGLRPWASSTPFESLLFAILGQQIHIGFAHRLRAALYAAHGARIGALHAPPAPAALAALDERAFERLRLSTAKASTIAAAARAVAGGELDLRALARGSAEVAFQRLQSLPGVGPWTAQYVLLCGFGLRDCLPAGDVALATAAQHVWQLDERPDAAALARRCAPFAPHRSWLTFHLWRSLAPATVTKAAGLPRALPEERARASGFDSSP